MIDKLKEKAKKKSKTIIFPEADFCERIVEAVKIVNKNRYAKCVLIGDRATLEKKFTNLSDYVIYDVLDNNLNSILLNELLKIRKDKGLTEVEAKKLLQNPIYYSALLVELGYADCYIAGAVTTTAETLKPAFQIIKTKKGINIASSCMFLFNKKLGLLCLADCGINVNPTSSELCDIAVSSAETLKKVFNIKPKVAFLSYSTFGSGKGEQVDVVREAVTLMKTRNVDFEFDGEFQADTALNKITAKIKAPKSKIAGNCNVLIFPDLQSGNIAYKLMQIAGDMLVAGPIVQGLNKMVSDLSRGATVEEIVSNVIITALMC